MGPFHFIWKPLCFRRLACRGVLVTHVSLSFLPETRQFDSTPRSDACTTNSLPCSDGKHLLKHVNFIMNSQVRSILEIVRVRSLLIGEMLDHFEQKPAPLEGNSNHTPTKSKAALKPIGLGSLKGETGILSTLTLKPRIGSLFVFVSPAGQRPCYSHRYFLAVFLNDF